MGPSLARRLRRATSEAGGASRVFAVSRFSDPDLARGLQADGVSVVRADLLDPRAVEALPDAADVLFLSGMKCGATARPDLTWAQNTLVPAHVARRYAGSRIVAFSTGNVYAFVPPGSGGSVETDATAPVGEYAQSCLGRERVFEYFAHERGTCAVLFRLFYAVDLRYGTLVDIAGKVFRGEPVDVSVSHVNAIWQGDANSYALRALALCAAPPPALNVTGPVIAVRQAAEFFAARFGTAPRFTGTEAPTALLGNARRCYALLGEPEVGVEQLMSWCADWVARGGKSLGKPTRFERSDGRF
jgi:hypothetical protein